MSLAPVVRDVELYRCRNLGQGSLVICQQSHSLYLKEAYSNPHRLSPVLTFLMVNTLLNVVLV